MTGPFTVIWRRRVLEKEIAEYVVHAIERAESLADITSAMHEIDSRLSANPNREGESRDEFERILIVHPLAVDFEVHEDERLVFILRARIITRPNP